MTKKLPLIISFFLTVIIFSCSKEKPKTSIYQWPIINGFPKPQVPADNPMTTAKVILGKTLFYDVNLSANQSQSCASCHIQKYAFAEPLTTSIGSTEDKHRRNSPALVNIAYNKTLTWAHDGLTSIEQQLLLPMFGEDPVELGITNHETAVLARFNSPHYQQLFQQAFPQQQDNSVTFDQISKALASFVRSLISLQSPFDQYAYANKDDAISASAIRGMNLFFSEKLECHHCHGGFNFTQSTSHEQQLIDRRPFHNTGLYQVLNNDDAIKNSSKNDITNESHGYPAHDTGLAEISTLAADNGRFRAPTLRNIEVSAPYMHDGSIATLAEVLDFYAAGGRNVISGNFQGDGRLNKLKSPFIKGFVMTEQDKNDLMVFLKTLTDQHFLTDPAHAEP
ncbi:MAG: di-heme enzyme [Colwellia sp.]|nr:di-heme enzyme [Colwellia sp.]